MHRLKELAQQNLNGTAWPKVEPKSMAQYLRGLEVLIDKRCA